MLKIFHFNLDFDYSRFWNCKVTNKIKKELSGSHAYHFSALVKLLKKNSVFTLPTE